MWPLLKTARPHQISSFLTLTKKRISNVFAKGIFGYLLRASLRVDTYNYVSASVTGSFSFTGSLVVTYERSCAESKQKKLSLCSMITLNCVPSLVSVLFDTPDIIHCYRVSISLTLPKVRKKK
jgi:hypothetical protein